MYVGSESHGGSCYCAVASLILMDRLNAIEDHRIKDLIKYCLNR